MVACSRLLRFHKFSARKPSSKITRFTYLPRPSDSLPVKPKVKRNLHTPELRLLVAYYNSVRSSCCLFTQWVSCSAYMEESPPIFIHTERRNLPRTKEPLHAFQIAKTTHFPYRMVIRNDRINSHHPFNKATGTERLVLETMRKERWEEDISTRGSIFSS